MSPTQTAIAKFQTIHGARYDYSQVVYRTAKTKITVGCSIHGDFLITPNNHLSGSGCPKCSGRGFSAAEKLSRFIAEGNAIHSNKYDYTNVDLSNKKLKIICPVHGPFYQCKIAHITNKSGCPHCGKLSAAKKTRLSVDRFIQKSINRHGLRYDYSKVLYQGAHKKVTITCATHGDFLVTPANHWSAGVGCPHCFNANPSKGETRIYNWLTEHDIAFESQKTFNDLYYKASNGRLKYDFYLPGHNVLIEFDGEYHYSPITFSKNISAEDQFALTQIRDRIKTNYATANGYTLIRIRFDDDVVAKLESLF